MTGALIADIAAGTYEKDKKLFFSKLICDNVKLSPLGNCLQTNGSLLVKNPHIAKEVFKRIVKDSYFEKSEANALIYVIAIAWVYDTIDEIEEIGTIVCQLKYFFMTQDLSWINNIAVNNLVNGGRSDIKPQIVGFYLPTPSSQKKKFNLTKRLS